MSRSPTCATRSILTSSSGSLSGDPLENPFLESRMALTGDADRLLIVMVGLPARGKSLVSHKRTPQPTLTHGTWDADMLAARHCGGVPQLARPHRQGLQRRRRAAHGFRTGAKKDADAAGTPVSIAGGHMLIAATRAASW